MLSFAREYDQLLQLHVIQTVQQQQQTIFPILVKDSYPQE
jgi:hypothetical protein